MIDVERLAELRHPSVLMCSPLSVAAATQRLRHAVDDAPPSDDRPVHGDVEFSDAIELWVRTPFMPWKLRAELVPSPTGCELRGAIGPFSHLAKPHLRYGLFLLWVVASLLGAVVALLAGKPDDAHGAAYSAVTAVVVAAVTAALDVVALRVNRPAQEYLLAWTAEQVEAELPPG